MKNLQPSFRFAQRKDTGLILAFIKALAEYEQMAGNVIATEELLGGRAGIYLEDHFILPKHRGKGYGNAMLKKLAATAVERGCGRLEWSCLDWNRPSIEFYLSLDASIIDSAHPACYPRNIFST